MFSVTPDSCLSGAGLGSDEPGGELIRTVEASLCFGSRLSLPKAGPGLDRPGGEPVQTELGQLVFSLVPPTSHISYPAGLGLGGPGGEPTQTELGRVGFITT